MFIPEDLFDKTSENNTDPDIFFKCLYQEMKDGNLPEPCNVKGSDFSPAPSHGICLSIVFFFGVFLVLKNVL